MFTPVDDILAHAQATMERFAAELGEKLKMKSMVEKFGVEKARRTSASSGGQPFLQVDEPHIPEEEKDLSVEVPVSGGCGGAHVDDNDDKAGHCVRGRRCC